MPICARGLTCIFSLFRYVEVSCLHDYRSLMWCGDARKALGKLRTHLIGVTVVAELLDDLLEAMLESWAFGEKESHYTVAGFVPSIKVSASK